MTGLMTNGMTNPPLDVDLAVQPLLCVPGAVEQSRSNTIEAAPSAPSAYPNADSWRVEVSARLERYRTRRKPRTPRYPSLLLPFDSPESWSRPAPLTRFAETVSSKIESSKIGSAETESATVPRQAEQISTLETIGERSALEEPAFAEPRQAPEQSAKVIEFPRSAAIPVFRPSDLADPVFDRDRPRIVEAPEILPPPPALGGMLIEPAHQELADRRPDFPAALPSASIARRVLAALVDAVILATALSAFAAIFLHLNPSLNPSPNSIRGPLPLLAAALSVVAVLLWLAYEFFFVVYTGSTPGLRAARLRLAAFDGSPLNRRARRWRVLASFLSAFSAGLGYLWCVLDQDGLCWHDRITRTHVQSVVQLK
jgi:uncharacterized RDD family membrane protein YckC